MEQRRDKRQANWFWMNKSIVDDYGSQIGAIGIAVYAILARCANEDGHAFPSVRYIARHLGLSTNTVLKYLGKLEKCRLITMRLRRDPAGDKDCTEYTLLPPIITEEQEGVSASETPQGPKASSSANSRRSRKEVSNEVRHGVSDSDTPQAVEVSNEVRHRVSTDNTPEIGGVSQLVKGGVSTGETFKDQENKKPITQDLSPPIVPSQGSVPSCQCARDTESIAHMEAGFQDYTPGFESVCAAHPKQPIEGKREAFGIWQARRLERRAVEIAEKLARLVVTKWKDRTYYPLLKTWLKNAGYDDDLVPLEVAQEEEPPRRPSYAETKRAERERERQRFVGGHDARSDRSQAILDGHGEVIECAEYRYDN